MRVLVHGFGSFPLLQSRLFEYSRVAGDDIDWRIALDSPYWQELVSSHLSNKKVSVIARNASSASASPNAIHRMIDVEKWGFKKLAAAEQEKRFSQLWHSISLILDSHQPDLVLGSHVENLRGKILVEQARMRGIPVAIPTSCRNLGGLYFSPDEFESLPKYAVAEEADLQMAQCLLHQFTEEGTPPAQAIFKEGDSHEVLTQARGSVTRGFSLLVRYLREEDNVDSRELLAGLHRRLGPTYRLPLKIRSKFRAQQSNVNSVSELSQPFVYFPLQYTPESSINTPAPEYIDQTRLIHEIRYGLPPGWVLVVREHPAAIDFRPANFIPDLLRLSGVRVANIGISNQDLIRSSSLTVSVTGTAVMEAFLMGLPAAAAGRGLPSQLVGSHFSPFDVPKALDHAWNISHQDRILSLARLLNVRHEANIGAPGQNPEWIVTSWNIRRFHRAFVQHLHRSNLTA